MKYKRKTRDEWVVQGNYGQGWEDVCAEDSRRAALVTLREYGDNERQYPHRLHCRRVAK